MRNTFIFIVLALTLCHCSIPEPHAYTNEAHALPVVAVAEAAPALTHRQELLNRLRKAVPLGPARLQPALNLSGTYELSREVEGYHFQIDIKQKGDSLFGSYCGGTETRVDCGMPSQGAPDCEIVGRVQNGLGYLAFRSCYSGRTGLATLQKAGQQVIWRTTEYPAKSDSEINYCAAPQKAMLRSTEAKTGSAATFPDYQGRTRGFLDELDESETQFIFSRTAVMTDVIDGQLLAYLSPGTPVRILETATQYGWVQNGDEIFEAPLYKIEFSFGGETHTGFLHHEVLALLHFRDSQDNLFMMGLQIPYKTRESDVILKVLGDNIGELDYPLNLSALLEKTTSYFPAIHLSLNTHSELTLGNFSMLEVKIEGFNPGEFDYQTLLSWDGNRINTVLGASEGLIPQGLVAQKTGDSLQISYTTKTLAKDAAFFHQVYALQNDSLKPLAGPKAPKMDLVFEGQHDMESFPDSWDNLDWHGIYTEDSSLYINTNYLMVLREELTDEGDGSTVVIKEVGPAGDQRHDFYWKGADFSPGMAGAFSQEVLKANQSAQMVFTGVDWQLKSTGWEQQDSFNQMAVYLTGTRNGEKHAQKIHFDPFREEPIGLVWCGDMDGDGLPDMILELAAKGFYSDARLFLSSLAAPGQLVGEAGVFQSVEPGA